MDDPRNINATFVVDPKGIPAIEYEINFTLPPHALDPTGEDIHVQGHIDQVRVDRGRVVVDDYKSGKKTGWEMIHDYAIQVAAYTYGARQIWPNAEPGRIIRGRGYRTRENKGNQPDGVFFAVPFKVKDVLTVLETVQIEIALMRMGHVRFGSGPHCTFCEYNGLTGCLPHWDRMIQLGK